MAVDECSIGEDGYMINMLCALTLGAVLSGYTLGMDSYPIVYAFVCVCVAWNLSVRERMGLEFPR